jgi:single-strand DNA-binding protein
VNKLYCTARLTRDIEIKEAKTGISIANIGLAIDNGMANGEKDTLFLTAKAFDKMADNAAKYLAKGSLISCDITVRNNNFEDADGKTKYGHEFIINAMNYLSTKPREEEPTTLNEKQISDFLGTGTKVAITDNLLD